MPFKGPIGAARVGYKDGKYLLNPTAPSCKESEARPRRRRHARRRADGRVRSRRLSEDVMLGAVMFGHEQMQVAIKAINELAAEAGKPRGLEAAPAKRSSTPAVAGKRRSAPSDAYQITEKQARYATQSRDQGRQVVAEALPAARRRRTPTTSATSSPTLEYNIVRGASSRASRASTVATRRPCARSRPRSACCRARTARRCSRAARRRRSWSPRSAPAATRRSSTRSTASAKSRSCSTTTSRRSRVGETGMMGSPKRREIGHGNLARRGVRP